MFLHRLSKKKSVFSLMVCLLSFCFLFLLPQIVRAEPPDQLDSGETYVRGAVVRIVQQGMHHFSGIQSYQEELQVKLLEGKEKNTTVSITFAWDPLLGNVQYIHQGEIVVVDSKIDPSGNAFYSIYQPYRVNTLLWIFCIFVVLILIVAGKKGLGALIGLTISIGTILFFIMPQILAGQDPLRTCILGSCFILLVTTYVAHGISIKTTVALISTALSLITAAFLSLIAITVLQIVGIGDQSDYALQLATTHFIHPQGLLLGGIIIGTLGALNDITTTQSITIFTLAKENKSQHFIQLFSKSMHIGREHIASLINTLVLAYAGSSFVFSSISHLILFIYHGGSFLMMIL